MAEGAGGDPYVVLWNWAAFPLQQSFNDTITSRGFQIVRGQRADLYQAMDPVAVGFGISGLFGSEKELADNSQREEYFDSAILAALKVYFLVQYSNGDVVSRRYLPLMEVHSLATLLDRLPHLVRGFVVQGTGYLKQILDRRSLWEIGDERADQLGCPPLLVWGELIQVVQDLCFDRWHDHTSR